jgi:hypothetical protein
MYAARRFLGGVGETLSLRCADDKEAALPLRSAHQPVHLHQAHGEHTLPRTPNTRMHIFRSPVTTVAASGHDRQGRRIEAHGDANVDRQLQNRAPETSTITTDRRVTSLQWWQQRMEASRRRRRPVASEVDASRKQQQILAFGAWRRSAFRGERTS